PYFRAAVTHEVREQDSFLHVRTQFSHRAHRGEIRLRARNEPGIPPTDSEEHFLKEHYWGFDRTRRNTSFRYRVAHPVWRTFPVEEYEVTIDPGALLSDPWQQVDWPSALHSVLFAEGSHAVVFGPEPLLA